MKRGIFLSLINILCHFVFCQSFRTVSSGEWTNPSVWEWQTNNEWAPAGSPPDPSADSVRIQHNHLVFVRTHVSVKNLVVFGELSVEAYGTLYSDLPGADWKVASGATIRNKGFIISSPDNLHFLHGSTYSHAFSATEGIIPQAKWDTGSVLRIEGYTTVSSASAAGNWSQLFGNVVWNTPGLSADFSLNTLLSDIRGNLVIQNTGASVLRFTGNQTASLSIAGDLQVLENARFSVSHTGPNNSHVQVKVGRDFIFISGAPAGSRICEQGTSVFSVGRHFIMDRGLLYFSSGSGGTSNAGADLKVNGDVIFTGGTLDASVANSNRVGDLFFTGTSEQNFTSSGSIIGAFHYRLAPGSIVRLDADQVMSGTSFECNACTILVGSSDPAGAIQKSATAGGNIRVRTQFWYPGSTIVYSGVARQFISSEHPQQSGITTVINNPAGAEISASSSGVVLGGPVEILQGGLTVRNNNLTIRGHLNTYGGPVLLSSSGLTSARTLTIDGDLLLTGSGERLKVESSETSNAANAVLVLNGNLGGYGHLSFSGPNVQLQIGGTARNLRRELPVREDFVLEQLTINSTGTTLRIDQPLTLGNYTSSSGSWTGGLFLSAGTLHMRAPLIIRSVASLTGGVLDFSGQEVELRRHCQTNWPVGVFASDRHSVLRLTSSFSGIENTIAFLPGKDTLGTLILDRSANFFAVGGLPVTPHLKINSPLKISSLLNLKDGELYNESGLTMLSGSTLVRTPDAAFSATTTLAPSEGPYRLRYINGQSAKPFSSGIESSGDLKALYVEVKDDVRVDHTLSIRDTLSLVSGSLTIIQDSIHQGQIHISGLLNINAGATLNSGSGGLILRNRSVTAAGRIGVLPKEAFLNGTVTVEHFLPGPSAGFRYLTLPVEADDSLVGQLSDDFKISYKGWWQYDESVPGPKDSGWRRSTGINKIHSAGMGFVILADSIRTTDQIWDITGSVHRGPKALPLTFTSTVPDDPWQDGWNLVGNPFPSPVLWSQDPALWSDKSGEKVTGIDPVVFVRDPQGSYRTWDARTGLGDLSGGTGIIPAGTAFWVHANAPNPELVIHEAAKVSAGGMFYRKFFGGKAVKLQFTASGLTQNCFMVLEPGASTRFVSGEDIRVPADSLLSAALVSSDGKPLWHYAADRVSEPIAIHLRGSKSITLQLQSIQGWESFPLWLEDRQQGRMVLMDTTILLNLVADSDRYFIHGSQTDVKPEEVGKKQIHIFPNPLYGQWLRLYDPDLSINRIVVMDVSGRRVADFPVEVLSPVIERMLDLIPGVYITELYTKTGIRRERFIIAE